MFNSFRNANKLHLKKPSDRFSYIKPQMKLICDIKTNCNTDSQMNTQSISEMYFFEDLLIILSEDGVIYIVDILCTHNQQSQPDIIPVRSIPFYSTHKKIAKSISLNLANGSLLIVYLLRDANFAELKCARISLLSLKQFMKGTIELLQINPEVIFQTENLSSPAFVEFDEFNAKIITRNSLATYKVWSMKDFKLVFEMTDKRIEEIRTADGIFLTIRSEETNERLLLSIYEIDSGRLVINYDINLVHLVELEILEIFDKVLLLKQAGSNALIINLINFEYHFIKNDNLDERTLFMYINKANIFVSLNKNSLIFYSIRGEELRSIKNENIDAIAPNFVHLTGDKNYLLVYWEKRKECAEILGNTQVNHYNNLRTPKSKNMTGKSSKVLLTENSNFSRGDNILLASVVKNANTSMSKLINSSMSDISNVNDVSDKWTSEMCFSRSASKYVTKKRNEIFKGEFELINLKETFTESKLCIDSDNLNICAKDKFPERNMNENNIKDNFSFDLENESEEVNYFIFNTKTMRMYIIMQSGKLYECAI